MIANASTTHLLHHLLMQADVNVQIHWCFFYYFNVCKH